MPKYIFCPKCKKDNVRHHAKGLCRKCYFKLYKPPKNECVVCGKIKAVAKRDLNGDSICANCYETPKEECCVCKNIRPVCKRNKYGSVCKKCYEAPKRVCSICFKLNQVAKMLDKKDICVSCYERPKEECIVCGNIEEVHKRTEVGCSICLGCYKKPEEKCVVCNEVRPVNKRINGEPMCEKCNVRIRAKGDKKFKIIKLLRNRVYAAFKKYSSGRKVRTADEYGINYEAIFEYIGQCPGGCGEYHIDHIFPLSAFDFNDPIHIKAAFAPENHQWLTKEENLSKSAKYNEEELKKLFE